MTRIVGGALGWPERLAELDDPPDALYLRPPCVAARLPSLLASPVVAIVGARRAPLPAAHHARRLARDVAAAGVAVVSGLAAGIDAAAHEGALDAGGRTLAVLGCGVDRDYPRSNAGLAARVGAAGAIVSEYAPGTPPAPWRFPARNRIVAALADAVVVVAASERSGALITARLALELGRDVLVVPGPAWESAHAGGNALLRDGALAACDAGDVLVALGVDPGTPRRDDADVSADAARVLAAVRRATAGADALVGRTGLASSRLHAAVSELELAGLIAIDPRGVIAAT